MVGAAESELTPKVKVSSFECASSGNEVANMGVNIRIRIINDPFSVVA